MMSFDECPQFYQPYDYVEKSIERTSRWAERGLRLTVALMIKVFSGLSKGWI